MMKKDSSTDDTLSFEFIRSELAEKEISEIDMRLMGNMIYETAHSLSEKVNNDILFPLSRWLNDPDWLNRFQGNGDLSTDWAGYKRKQRIWTVTQKRLAAERLKLYWQEIRQRRNFRNAVSKLISTNTQNRIHTNADMCKSAKLNSSFLQPIVSPFSPQEQVRSETLLQFQQAHNLSVSNLLPWKLIIIGELSCTKKFSELKSYYLAGKKEDVTAKLIHLLQMETDGEIELTQSRPFGEITIESVKHIDSALVNVKDKEGRAYEFDWLDLNRNQKSRLIDDIRGHNIICRCGW
jgi:hypothetical protein